jgi:hypothetical protein
MSPLWGLKLSQCPVARGDEISGTPSKGIGCMQFNWKSLLRLAKKPDLRD